MQEARAQLAHAAAAAAAAAQAINEVVQETEAAAAEAAQRDPRRNGMDNPFGDGRPDPMHPSLARLTGVAHNLSVIHLHALLHLCQSSMQDVD